MATATNEDIVRSAFGRVNTALNQMADTEAAEAVDLQNSSDDLDRILAGVANGTITPELIAEAQAIADRIELHAEVAKANAAFAKATAAKVADPVPLPVPEPVPPTEG